MNKLFSLTLVLTALLLNACGGGGNSETTAPQPAPDPTSPVEPEPEPQIEHLSGGETSTPDNTADAFSERSYNMSETDRIAKFELGDDFFQNPWVAGSASTSQRDGLGGLFNNNACQDCHIRDGRGHAPNEHSDDFNSILFRAAKSNITDEQREQMIAGRLANIGDDILGGQLQQHAITGVLAEVELSVEYELSTVTFEDGYEVELRKPIWQLTNLYQDQGYDFSSDTVFSARVSPQMIGLGLLQLVSESDILANADENDDDNNGISGKANYVWSIEQQAVALGRFGWKAGQPTITEQTAAAFVNDMGLTNRIHQNEICQSHQQDCQIAPNGNGDSVNSYDYEVSDTVFEAVSFYSNHLSVPQRQNAYDDDVQRGKALFAQLECNACHVASFKTGASEQHPELSQQTIFPYTDMLLHDMGPDLADFDIQNQAATNDVLYEFKATAREWRTPPLWGLGRAQTVDSEATFLHDGRARTILEAILWHGGEAEAIKQAVLKLDAQQRQDLLAFLSDL